MLSGLKNSNKHGFTIVELLIVVVVVAILAAITIVAYNGIQQRATNSALQSDLSQVAKKLETYKITNTADTYPADLATAGITSGGSGSLSYSYSASSDSYCAQIVKGSTSFVSSSSSTTPTAGNCTESGLTGWWKLNNNAVDSSPNGNNGVTSATTATTGENGVSANALLFTSASSSMLTVPSSASLYDNPQTFSLWIKPIDWSTPNASIFLAKRSSTANGYAIGYLVSNSSVWIDCGGSSNRWISTYAPPTNEWTNLLFTCSLDGNLAFYANGQPKGTKSGINRTNINDPISLRFGRDSTAGGANFLNGSLDDIRIYNRVLSNDEIQQIYNGHAQ